MSEPIPWNPEDYMAEIRRLEAKIEHLRQGIRSIRDIAARPGVVNLCDQLLEEDDAT